MAKVGLWLRGARGKYAGGVLQKGVSGGTIVRENVKPANPQSSNQCGQRMKMLPAARFYTLFEEVLSTSFEGVAYGNKSRWAFLKRALASPAVVCPKNAPTNYVPPLKVDVSSGSLSAISSENLIVFTAEGVRQFDLRTYGYHPTDAETVTLGKWNETSRGDIEVILRKIFGLPDEGFAQITFIFQAVAEDDVFFDKLPRLSRKYARIKLGYGLATDSKEDSYSKILQDIVFEPSDEYGCLITSNGDPDGLFGNVGAMAVITSAFVDGVWRRSTSRYVMDASLEALYFDDDALLEESRASYVKSYNASSSEYLNGGEG